MYTLREEPPGLRALDDLSRSLVQQICSGIAPGQVDVKLSGGQNIKADALFDDHLLVIKEGIVHYSINDHTLFIYEAGDLIGIEHLSAAGIVGDLLTDFAIVCDCYSRSDLMGALMLDSSMLERWCQYTALQNQIYCILIESLQRAETHFSPRVVSFEPGDVIIQQSSSGDEVFTLTEGAADVFVDGVKVGEISGDEIFGAIAAFTTTQRTASVVAREPSIILSLSRDNFSGLMQSRPGTVEKLIEDMAGRIVALNKKVVELSDKQGE